MPYIADLSLAPGQCSKVLNICRCFGVVIFLKNRFPADFILILVVAGIGPWMFLCVIVLVSVISVTASLYCLHISISTPRVLAALCIHS